MNLILSKSTRVKLTVLGWYQIIGGIAGLLLTFWLLAKTETINGLIIIIYLIAFGLYSYSIYCGRLLLGNKYSTGLKFSIINQLLQIFSFLMMGYGFLYIAGCELLASINYNAGNDSTGLKMGFNFSLTSTWRIFFNSDDRSFDFSINLVAIFIAIFIYRLQKTIMVEQLTTDNDLPIDSII